MNTPTPIDSIPSFRRRLFSRSGLVAFVAGAAIAAGIGAAAGQSMGGWHHGPLQGDVDHMLKHLYVEIDATDAQQAQIGPLVKQAMADLKPLHDQLESAHAQALQALTQGPLDRSTLETARLAHLQLADQASKRIVQLIADVGEVLTLQQRKSLGEHLSRLHAMARS